MKKKRALLLFGSLAALVLGYVAWCARPMYLSVPVPELLEIPEKHRADVRSLLVKHGLTGPDSFDRDAFFELLSRPYDSEPTGIMIDGHVDGDEGMLIAFRKRRFYHMDDPDITFLVSAGNWRVKVEDAKTYLVIEERALVAGPP